MEWDALQKEKFREYDENDGDVLDDKDIVQSGAPHAQGSHLMTSVMSSLTHGGLAP